MLKIYYHQHKTSLLGFKTCLFQQNTLSLLQNTFKKNMLHHFDIHTHKAGNPQAILSLEPEQAIELCTHNPTQQPYSIALHPAFLHNQSENIFKQAISHCIQDPLCMAIGECGLDKYSETPLITQIKMFEMALSAAKTHHLPTIIHCVHMWNEMRTCVQNVWGPNGAKEALSYHTPLIVHGFRKKAILAEQLLHAGFCLSIGEHFQEGLRKLIPNEQLYFETDTSTSDIETIKEKFKTH